MIRSLIRRLFAWLTQPLYYDPEDPLEEYWSRRREEQGVPELHQPEPRDAPHDTEARDESAGAEARDQEDGVEARDQEDGDPGDQRSSEIPQNRRYPSSRSGRGAKR